MLRAGRDCGDDLIRRLHLQMEKLSPRRKRSESELLGGRAQAQYLAHTAAHGHGFYLKGHLAS